MTAIRIESHNNRPVDRAVVIFAPNVRAGGGLVLLAALLKAEWPTPPSMVFLDARAKALLQLPEGLEVRWVRPGIVERLRAEYTLRANTKSTEIVLCFHGLPPLFRLRARVVVYLQNRLLVEAMRLSNFSLRTRIRLGIERWLLQRAHRNVDEYLTQTPSMLVAAKTRCRSTDSGKPAFRLAPFAPALLPRRMPTDKGSYRWDFIYPASSEYHKNHTGLMEAWRILARHGEYPTLALTLPPGNMAEKIGEQARAEGLKIQNLGIIPNAELADAYEQARALIFPSLSESLGLPLIEASRINLPILAGELDYVRDVCTPHETFDPGSAVSIARAVRRFMGRSEASPLIYTPEQVIALIVNDGGVPSTA